MRTRRLSLILLASALLSQAGAGQELKQIRLVAVHYKPRLSSLAIVLTDHEFPTVLNNSRYQIELRPDYFETTLFRCGLVSRIIREIV